MKRLLTRLVPTVWLIGFLTTSEHVEARSLGELLKALGNSIAHPQKRTRSARVDRQKESKKLATKDASVTAVPADAAATPILTVVRIATAAPSVKGRKRDVPYAIPNPKQPGFVTSPYAPNEGLVDVRGFSSGSEVKDPYSGKIFLTP